MDLYKKQFETRKNTPAYWHNKSQDLFVSARTLWKAMEENKSLEVNCWSTYKMLMGMSFELLFKAHCVGAGIDFEMTHDLVGLAKSAKLPTSEEENKILNVLSEYVLWDGRYPTPKKDIHLKNHWQNENKIAHDKQAGSMHFEISNKNLDLENLSQIWRKSSDLFLSKYN